MRRRSDVKLFVRVTPEIAYAIDVSRADLSLSAWLREAIEARLRLGRYARTCQSPPCDADLSHLRCDAVYCSTTCKNRATKRAQRARE